MSVESLYCLREILQQSKPLPPDVAAWLHAGIDLYLRGESDTLDEALELTRTARTARALEQRNAHLKRAWSLLAGSDRARARDLAKSIRRISSCARINEKDELSMVLKAAWDAWPVMPDKRQLARIACDIDDPSNVTKEPAES